MSVGLVEIEVMLVCLTIVVEGVVVVKMIKVKMMLWVLKMVLLGH